MEPHFVKLWLLLCLCCLLYYEQASRVTWLTNIQIWEVNHRMNGRRRHLEKECNRLGLIGPNHKANPWEYMINSQYHIIWCNIFKAASTTWFNNFNLLANYSKRFLKTSRKSAISLARLKYVRPTTEMINENQRDSILFLIVRHPFERLVSAYNDKIVHAYPGTHHYYLRHDIIKKFRLKTSYSEIVPKERYPLFEEFVDYLLSEVKANHTLDMHWTPYTTFCTPCKFKYDVVMKLETLDEDQKFLIQLAGLNEIVQPKWKNKGHTSQINNLFSRLMRSQLDGLYELYKHDFLLFNYSINDYYKVIQDDY